MRSQSYVRISGWGKYLPARIMRNAELAELVDTSDEWIRARTGIGERRIAAPEETTCSLAVNAARVALARANTPPEDLDMVIVATCTPDYANMPATASLVQHALGAPRAAAVDLNAVCSGFIYGLATGSQFIATRAYRNVLVIGAEVFTRILDWQDRSTCVLFGDGAGAVLLQPTDTPGGLLSFVLGSDGAGACSLYVPAAVAANRRPPTPSPSVDIMSRCRAETCSASPRGCCLTRLSRRSRRPNSPPTTWMCSSHTRPIRASSIMP